MKLFLHQTKNYGLYEIQDWPVDWKSIEGYIMGAVDETTGDPLQYGNPVISGLKVDRNSYGGFRISDISEIRFTILSEIVYGGVYPLSSIKTPFTLALYYTVQVNKMPARLPEGFYDIENSREISYDIIKRFQDTLNRILEPFYFYPFGHDYQFGH